MRIEANDQQMAAASTIQAQSLKAQQLLTGQNAEKIYREDTTQATQGDKVSVQVEVTKKTAETLQKLGNISDLLNTVASSIRKTNEGLKAASDIIGEMKGVLDSIIKNFPPFPVESKERMEQLMSYSSLHKQIESMMVPPPPPPVYEKVKHLWTGLVDGQNRVLKAPILPLDVPDSHLKAAVNQLDALSSQIDVVREAMGNSVKAG